MNSVFRRFCLGVLVLGIAWSTPAWAQQTGTLAGVVRDAQGGVLPGVTVTATSPALITPRTTTTSETGNYQLTTLPPGVYVISYEITGFNPLKREGIAIEVARTTRLEVELTVGTLQETVTVSGESPVVDVSSNVTQTNITRELYEAIPTGRNPWVMAGLVPGVVTGRLDVGGTEGMQQYNLEAFGSADSQKSFSIDGLKTNWPGGNGGATMQYYGFEMYEEYNMQTASGTAESDVSGVYMNMVTKSGGNNLHSDHNLYFMNDALQGENLDDDLRRRLGLGAGAQTGAAGNPIDISYDWSSTLGGPIRRDKAWFFGAMRWWRLDQLQIGALNPDGSQAIDDNRIRNFMGKATYQVTQNGRSSFMFNRNLKDRFHRRDAPYLFVEDKASVLQDQPAQNFVVQHNQVIGATGILDARFGRMWGTFPSRYQPDVQPTDIALRDVNRNTRVNAAEIQSLNPNHRYQANGTFSYFVPNLAGTHDFKAGAQLSWEKMQYDRIRNGDILLEMRDGVPFQGQISNTPIVSDHRVETWGLFLQDRWGFHRATINVGLRIDGTGGRLPAQSSPAGSYVGERSFPESDVYDFGPNVMPRIGISYDLRGNGQTAIKAYAGRFYNQFGSSDILEQANPNALATQNVVWNDHDGNLQLDAGELGAIPTFARGLFPTVDPASTRPFSDEFSVGIEHQIVTSLAAGVSYHRRHHRDGLGVLDRARPPSAYTPEERTYTDADGQVKPITIYKLRPEFGALRDRAIANVAGLESTYNGVQFDVQKKMSNRWQMLAGLSIQKHEGFDHSGTFTNVELNNPNARINRDNGSVFIDLPWAFTLSGSYLTPWWDIALSGKYTARAGDPLNRTVQLSFTSPTATQPSEVIRVVQRGVDRTDDVTKFLDLRFSKRARFGRSSLEGTIDLFNVLNANHVLEQVVALGSTFGRPSRILTPRIVRFGVTARF